MCPASATSTRIDLRSRQRPSPSTRPSSGSGQPSTATISTAGDPAIGAAPSQTQRSRQRAEGSPPSPRRPPSPDPTGAAHDVRSRRQSSRAGENDPSRGRLRPLEQLHRLGTRPAGATRARSDDWTSWAKGRSLPLDRIQTMTDTLENAYGVHAPVCEALATSVHRGPLPEGSNFARRPPTRSRTRPRPRDRPVTQEKPCDTPWSQCRMRTDALSVPSGPVTRRVRSGGRRWPTEATSQAHNRCASTWG